MECAACMLLMARLERAEREYAQSLERLSGHLASANRNGYRELLDRVKTDQNEFDFVARTIQAHQARHREVTESAGVAASDSSMLNESSGPPLGGLIGDEISARPPSSLRLAISRIRKTATPAKKLWV